ncbi:MAG: glutaredoxin 3 [Myxococcota bacterium]|jgi:glutaredoxin 3
MSELRVKIYTRSWCGYCTAAIRLLKSKSIPFEEIDLSGDGQGMAALKARTGYPTMPQVFVDDALIGGYTELDAYVRSKGAESLS